MRFILKGVNSEVKLNSNISWNLQLPVTLLILKVSLYRNYKYMRTARPEPEASAVGLQRSLSSVSRLLTVALSVPSPTSLGTRCMGATLAPSKETSSSETHDIRIKTCQRHVITEQPLWVSLLRPLCGQVVIYCDAHILRVTCCLRWLQIGGVSYLPRCDGR